MSPTEGGTEGGTDGDTAGGTLQEAQKSMRLFLSVKM